MKVKTCFFVTSLNSGGIENYLLRFLQFSKDKIQATVYCKSGGLGDLEQEYLDAGANLKPFKIGMFSVKDFFKLHKELKKEDYDSVVDFTGNFAAIPLLIAKRAGIDKRIAFYRGSSNHFREDILRLTYNNFVNRLIPKVTTDILSNSEAAFDFFFKNQWKSDHRFKVIYNGINANSFLSTNENLREELNIPKNAFVVGHVGRYNVAKNHKTMIKVAIELCKDDADVYFVFCGNKVIEGLEAEVRTHHLENQIKLLGFRKDVIKVLNTLNCFYFPSLTEGQPNALIEAMLAGVPFIASNIDSIKETVPVKFHKQFTDPLDKEMAIEKIERIKNDKSFADSLDLSTWTRTNFDAEMLFSQFYRVLTA